MPPTSLQLPFNDKPAEQVGKNLWRKQVLRPGSVEHKGQTLQFSQTAFDRTIEKFVGGAMDSVPFVLANAANRHNDDPERVRGEVKTLDRQADGLYATFELTDEGSALIERNPKLGASVRLTPDGVLKHVCGTLDPVVQGMKPWEKVELSDDDTVVDLTGDAYSETAMDALSDKDVAKLKALADKVPAGTEEAEPSDADVAKALAAIAAEAEAELEDGGVVGIGPEAKPELVASLSDEAKTAIELAQTTATTAVKQASDAQAELARERFKREKGALVRAGVPPVLVDLAQPVLERSAATIELSNGDKADAQEIVRKMLHEAKGTINLSEVGQTGASKDERDEARETVKKIREQG